mmetsp:Transcript_84396/g.247522  ORF Transcript_84396/g.247522 Transcript_84396/m.247522 type:complete len:380 (+) Transcript_84396:347-1486(+)
MPIRACTHSISNIPDFSAQVLGPLPGAVRAVCHQEGVHATNLALSWRCSVGLSGHEDLAVTAQGNTVGIVATAGGTLRHPVNSAVGLVLDQEVVSATRAAEARQRIVVSNGAGDEGAAALGVHRHRVAVVPARAPAGPLPELGAVRPVLGQPVLPRGVAGAAHVDVASSVQTDRARRKILAGHALLNEPLPRAVVGVLGQEVVSLPCKGPRQVALRPPGDIHGAAGVDGDGGGRIERRGARLVRPLHASAWVILDDKVVHIALAALAEECAGGVANNVDAGGAVDRDARGHVVSRGPKLPGKRRCRGARGRRGGGLAWARQRGLRGRRSRQAIVDRSSPGSVTGLLLQRLHACDQLLPSHRRKRHLKEGGVDRQGHAVV